jgi:hypothetical protein
MRNLRITLDKSAVYGLRNEEADSLDRYFSQVVPSILIDEILADLTKETDPKTPNRIAAHTYRVSGNHGLTLNYRTRLINSLLGREIPMDGRFLPSRETVVRTASGSLATIVETPLEDAILARWERCEFTDEERVRAKQFRQRMERPLDTKFYLDNIARAGLPFNIPQSDEELVTSVNDLLANRKLSLGLFGLLFQQFEIPYQPADETIKRWYKEGRKPIEEFAPYAHFCLKANFLWHLSLTNSQLFKPDTNDRKDLEYCYYLPNTQIFASSDKKQRRLMAALIRPDQSLVNGDELKRDLRKISEEWDRLTTEEKIALNVRRGAAPPENTNSVVYQLWKKQDGEMNPSRHREMSAVKLIDVSLPKEQQVPFSFHDFVKKKMQEIREGKKLSATQLEALNQLHKGDDPSTMLMFNSRISKERLKKWYPELTDADVDKLTSEILEELWLEPYEYRNLVTYG